MLSMLDRVLSGRGHRVLLAVEARSAMRLIHSELGIECVIIRDGLDDSKRIEGLCFRREINVVPFRGVVDESIVRLRLPDSRIGSRIPYAPRILIVDDEPAERHLFERVLSEDGYLVTAVGTGREALAAARYVSYDVMVVDLSLPDIDGNEVIAEIRSEFPWIGALAVSGYITAHTPKSVTAGVTAALGKPINPRELRMAVYRMLDPSGRWQAGEPRQRR